MQIKVKKLPKSIVEMEITTTETQWKEAYKLALQKLNQKMTVGGFRKGHIPEKVLIEKLGGEHAMEHQVIEVILPKTYAEAIKKENLPVIAQPEIEIVQQKPFIYKAKVAVYPEVILSDYQKVKIEKQEAKVKKTEIEEWVEKFQKQASEEKEVERKAKKGDKVEVDFEGFTLDGVPLDNTKSKNHPVVLGENALIPGFEEEIIGMEPGMEKEFKITFPKDYHAKNLANKEVKFKIKLNKLLEFILPDLNEDFVQKITGEKKSLESFRKEIEESLLEKKKQETQTKRENDWLAEVTKKAKMEIPEILINEEVEFMLDDMKMNGLQQGLPWEKYLQHLKKSEADLKKDFEKSAEERVRLRMVAQEIIKKEKITVPEEEVEKRAEQIIAIQPPQQQAQYRKHYEIGTKGFMQLKNQMIFEKMFQQFLN